MKTPLLTMAALVWAASAMAGTWDEPTPPSDENGTVVVDGGHYYATPKGTGQFLLGSNSWGTQASLDNQGYEVVLYHNVTVGNTNGMSDTWSIAFPVIPGNPDYAGDFLFVEEDPNSIFCNAYNGKGNKNLAGNRNKIHFTFKLNEDGKTYRIRSVFGPEGQYLGWDGVELGQSQKPLVKHRNPESVSTDEGDDDDEGVWGDEDDEEESTMYIDWAFIPAEAYAVYDAKVKLYNMFDEADEKNVSFDDILVIYEKEDATVEEINAAIETLSTRMLNVIVPGEENDVTFLIKNADCAADAGWEGNFGNQTARYANEDEPEALIEGRFFEAYAWQTNIGDNKTLKQTIDVPAGKYRLKASIIAVDQWNGTDVEGVTLFADAGSGFYVESDPISTENGKPQLISIDFECVTPVTIGVKVQTPTTVNWVAVDNFKLYMLDKIANPNEIALKAKLEELKKYDEDDRTFCASTKDELQALIKSCNGATGEDVCAQLAANADSIIARIEKEVVAYGKLETLAKQVETDADTYEDYGVYGEWLGDYADEIGEHIKKADWSVAEIENALAIYEDEARDKMKEYIASGAIKEGSDVSILIKNRDMDQGPTWVNNADQPQIPGWNPESTSPWGYDQSAGEFWNMDFDFYQDIEGLPEGKYTVSFQGFYRWGSPDEVAAAYSPDADESDKLVAVIYGNQVETPFQSICRGRCSAEELGGNTGGYARCGSITNEDGEEIEMWMPNSMTTFAKTIERDPEAYRSAATAVVGPDGHLRIGIKCKSNIFNRWVIFDQFRLRYDGNKPSYFFETMDELTQNLVSKRDNSLANHSLPKDVSDEVSALATECETLTGKNATTTKEQCMDFFVKLNTLTNKLDSVNTIISGLMADQAYYFDYSSRESWPEEKLSTKFTDMLDKLNTIAEDEGYNEICAWATTDELVAMANEFNAQFVKDVVAAADQNATENNPSEITEVIRNPQLFYDDDEYLDEVTENDIKDWNGAWGSKNQWGLSEYFSRNFDLNQTIAKLPKGYYRVTVDGFYRFGNSDTAAVYHAKGGEYLPAKLYARQIQGTDTITRAVRMMSICTGAEEVAFDEMGDTIDCLNKYVWRGPNAGAEATAVDSIHYYVPNTQTASRAYLNAGRYQANSLDFYSDGGDMRIGIRKDSTVSNDWTIFDNFRLYYLGQTAPVGIIAVEDKGGSKQGLAAKQAYFTVGGLQLARPQRGVNIVVTTLSDGTRVTSKVIVK